MAKPPPPPPARAGRVVTLDYLTAASHPDAVVTGVLLLVIGLLVAVGLAGLVGPVLSLELFKPDLTLSDLMRSLGQIGVSALALVAAGLGLAKHPRFPTFYLVVAFGLTVLVSLTASLSLFSGGAVAVLTGPGAFPALGTLVVLAVPYVVFSRKCRLIFQRRLSFKDLERLPEDQDWSAAAAGPAIGMSVLPRPEPARPAAAPARRSRAKKTAPAGERGPVPGGPGTGSLTVPAAPPADATAAALWAALYGPSGTPGGPHPGDGTATGEPSAAPTSASRRVGLESLINLRPPGS